MNSSAAPVTRPSARVAEDSLRPAVERASKSFGDRSTHGDGLNPIQLPRPLQTSGENVVAASTKDSFAPRPSAELLLPAQPLGTGRSSARYARAVSGPSQRGFARTSAAASSLVPRYRASYAQQQSLLERLLSPEGGLSPADTAALARHKPLTSDVFHEAILAYLESTGRHDVVMAMLQDERNAQLASQHTNSPPLTTASTGIADRYFSGATQPSSSVNAAGVSPGWSKPASAASAPSLPSRMGISAAHEEPSLSISDTHHNALQKAKAHAPTQRRSHDLLKKGLLETYAQWARESRLQSHHHGTANNTTATGAPAGGRYAAAAAAHTPNVSGSLAFSPTTAPSLSHVLATLYGMPPALRGDITLLYCDIEDKLRLQYEAYALIPPAPRVLAQIGAQLRQPMWSAQDTAESIHLPPVRNPATGKVVMGTLNQLVEELTHVYVRVSSAKRGGAVVAPSKAQADADAAFTESFFRQHRLFTPSSVLLAKLLERFTVPISVELGFEHFESHGITIHVEDGGRALPRERSQSETVVRLRSAAETVAWDAEQLWPSRSSTRADDGSAVSLRRSSSPWRATPAPAREDGREYAGWQSPSLSERAPPGSVATGTGSASGSPMRLVTHYTGSATLWLLICEKIRTKVLSVLLMWMQRHPNHFDISMIHCVLHFVEECCYEPTQWSDCSSTFPQIAELLRDEAYSILDSLERERALLSAAGDTTSSRTRGGAGPGAPAEPVDVMEVLRDGGRGANLAKALPFILSAFAMDDRLKHLRSAVPPSLRDTHLTMPTWLSAAVTLPNRLLPSFAYRHDDILSFDTAFRSQAGTTEQTDPVQSPSSPSPSAAAGQSAFPAVNTPPSAAVPVSDRSALAQARLHNAAQRALERFNRFTMEEYVAGLTSAHQLLFGLFPAQDLATLAEHTTAEYLSSRKVRQSHLVVFLRTAADMTAWTVSLLLHAAFLDGEQVSASMANASIASSLLNAGGDIELLAPSVTHQRASSCGVPNPYPYAHSASGEGTSSGGALDGRASPTQQVAGGAGNGSPRSVPSLKGLAAKLDAGAMVFVSTTEALLDLVVAFLRVNNVHASYAIFRGFCHPFVQRILRHPALLAVLNPHTLRRISKLELFYGLDARDEEGAAAAAYDDANGSFTPQHFTQSMGASITSDVGIGGAHVLPDFLKAVSDSAEFPTIPAIPFHLREMRYAMTHEPTFLTTTCGDFPITKVTAKGEGCEPLVCVVNWRKLRIIDDITQRVNTLQREALFYVSSKSTVVHSLSEDIELERAFREQLDEVVVTDVQTLQAMANSLLAVLQ